MGADQELTGCLTVGVKALLLNLNFFCPSNLIKSHTLRGRVHITGWRSDPPLHTLPHLPLCVSLLLWQLALISWVRFQLRVSAGATMTEL